MCRWLLASSVLALAAAEQSRAGADNPVVKIVKLLTDMEKTLKADVGKQEKAYKKVDCAATKQIEANEELITRNEDKIDVAVTERDSVDVTTLTDESQQLSDQIGETNGELENANKALQDSIAKYEVTKKDLDDGIGALQEAKASLAGDTASSFGGFLSKISKLSAIPSKHNTMLSNMMKVAEEPGKNLDTIKDMCDTLLQEFQEESNDVELSHKQDKAAQEALIDELQQKKEGLQLAFHNGDGERAAKDKRKGELKEIIDNATLENDDAKIENALATDVKKTAKQQWNAFHTDMLAQLSALKEAKDILIEEGRALFQKVTANDFLQTSMFTVSRVQATSAVQTLIDAIADFDRELGEERDDIAASVSECDRDSKSSLENGNQAAEQMDGHQAAIEAAQAVIEAETKKQKETTDEIVKLDDERKAKNKVFLSTTKELSDDADDLDAAVSVVEKAVVALNKYAPAAEKTNFHSSNEGNPFAGVITMLDSAKMTFTKDAANLRTEVDFLTSENVKMNAEVGTPSQVGNKEFDIQHGEKKGEKRVFGGFVDCIDMPQSIIGNLEKDRNLSIMDANTASVDKAKNAEDMANENRTLYGDDGEGGVWGGIKKRQQQCDYWMINGPVRQEAIDSERKALSEAKIVLTNDPELGLAAGDEATLAKREAGANAVDHGFNEGSKQ